MAQIDLKYYLLRSKVCSLALPVQVLVGPLYSHLNIQPPFTSIHIYHSSTLCPALFLYMWPELPLHNSRPGLVALWS